MDYKMELCSSMCSCPLLKQMHENFVRKFRVMPSPTVPSSIELNEANCSNNFSSINDPVHLSEELQQVVGEAEAIAEESLIVGSIDYKILDEDSRTPIPVYEMMGESELNTELTKYGHGPMGRRAAIKLLNQIFEATHLVLSESTPIPRKIARIIAADKKSTSNENARQKRARAKIAELMTMKDGNQHPRKGIELTDVDGTESGITYEKENHEQMKDSPSLRWTFLSWLRKPGNERLYHDLLLLNPVFSDKLYISFKQDIKDDVKMSKEAFMEMLDKLGVTHCARNDPVENQ